MVLVAMSPVSAAFTPDIDPGGTGDVTQLNRNIGSSNWTAASSDDNSSSYVFTKGSGSTGRTTWYLDLYSLPDQVLSGSIGSVTVYFEGYAEYTSFDQTCGRTALKTHGNVFYGNNIDLDNIWTTYSTNYVTNPSSGLAWTWTEINDLQAGVSLRNASGLIDNLESRCTHVWVVIDYVANNPVPTTIAINPANKNVGDAQFTLTVSGTNFVSGSVVRANGADRATTFVTATQLTAVIPASDLAVTGTVGITVFNPAPGGGESTPAVPLTVSKPTASLVLGGLTQTYDGNPKLVTATTNPVGLSVTLTYQGSATAPTNAGSYTVVGTINDPVYQGSNSGTLVIAKANPSIIWPDPAGISYGTALSAAQLNATASVPGVFAYTPASGSILKAGPGQTLSVIFTPDDILNYNNSTDSALISVTTRELTIGGSFAANSKTYDSTNTATAATNLLELTGKIGTDDVILTPVFSFTTSAGVGSDKTVSLTVASSLSGADAANYSLSLTGAPTSAANITPATVTPSVTVSNKTYDGTTSASIATRSLTGIFAPDVVALNGGTAVFDSAAAGNGKTVSVTGLSITGAGAANYSLSATTATTSADITPKDLLVTGLSGVNRVYDGTTAATVTGTAILSGVIAPDVVTLQGTPSFAFGNKNVATTNPITATGYTLAGAGAGNYRLTPPALSANITAKVLTVGGSFTANSKIYDGNAATTIATSNLTLTGVVAGDNVALNPGTAALFADKNVGIGKMVSLTAASSLSGADGANYTLSLTGAPTAVANITAATVTPSVTVNNKTYDGTTSVSIATRSLTGVIAPDVVALSGGTAVFDSAAVGDGKTVSVTGLSLTGAGAANYSLSTTTVITTANITQQSGGGGSSGSGGGGGGGFGNQLIGIGLSGTSPFLDGNGKSLTAGQISTPDNKVELNVPVGVYVWNAAGAAQAYLSATVLPNPPEAPPQNSLVMAWDLGPSGVTFTPAITITFKYADSDLPARSLEKDLYIAWWDGTSWIKLLGTVDSTANVVTAQITHFTDFALIAPAAPPAPAPTLKIASPATGAAFDSGSVTLSINSGNINLVANDRPNAEGEGHVVYYLDVSFPTLPGQSALTAPGTFKVSSLTSNTWTDLAPGTHTLGVQLVQNDSTPFNPPVYTSISVLVKEPPVSTTVAQVPPNEVAKIVIQPPAGGLNPIMIAGILLMVSVFIVLALNRRNIMQAVGSHPPKPVTRNTEPGKNPVSHVSTTATIRPNDTVPELNSREPSRPQPPIKLPPPVEFEAEGEYIIRLHNAGADILADLRDYFKSNPNIKFLVLDSFNDDIQLNIRLEKGMPIVKELADKFPLCKIKRTGRIILFNNNE
jgi:hypothetical protein